MCAVQTRSRCERQRVWIMLAALFLAICSTFRSGTDDDDNGSVSVNDKELSGACEMRYDVMVSF